MDPLKIKTDGFFSLVDLLNRLEQLRCSKISLAGHSHYSHFAVVELVEWALELLEWVLSRLRLCPEE